MTDPIITPHSRAIPIPDMSLVVLIGASGSGKSTFARTHFKPTEILSSDHYRGVVADDENDQSASKAAFDVLHYVARTRLASGRVTVIDATNVQHDARKPLVALARELHCLPVAIVLDVPPRVCVERNAARPDRAFGAHVIRNHASDLRRSLRHLRTEGFRHVYVLDGVDEIAAARVERQRLWNDKRDDHGPFDIVGDVHGCIDELRLLMTELGYAADGAHPEGRRLVFVGDLVDRGPDSPAVLELVMKLVADGRALCVPGNHEAKLARFLEGKNVKRAHGIEQTIAQLESKDAAWRERAHAFIDKLVSHYVLDDGKLVVAHAGLKETLQGRASGVVRSFALFGETTGETDEMGLPVRYNWAAEYRGKATVVYGHTPVPDAVWVNKTICIDTGCCFGGQLTALRWPERELVSVDAARTYYEPTRQLAPSTRDEDAQRGDLLDIGDVDGKRLLSTRLRRNVTIRAENAAAALEVMSRFAVDPRWLVYLPPTMSPVETCKDGELLEHPRDAFAYFAQHGVDEVICEEKHMGSRAIVIVCKDAHAARARFGTHDERDGVMYTRTGRPFFADAATESAVLARVRDAVTRADLWTRLATDWLVLDAELMPWSAKARDLVRTQYANVGAAARTALTASLAALERARARSDAPAEIGALVERMRTRVDDAGKYVDAYRRYCWDVASVDDYRLAPFHLLASEGAAHVDKDHVWHMSTLAELAAHGAPLVMATQHRMIRLADTAAVDDAIAWWHALTANGGEGFVVKPRAYLAKDRRGYVQPALKVRGREYLRIIYGPEYTAQLERLRARGLSAKRSLALRELALGVESLARFVDREPLYRVHECVFGVLALESEPVDPRL